MPTSNVTRRICPTPPPALPVVTAAGHPWWRDSVVYQVFLPSFADGNGDGVGDLPGLTSRVPYLAELGVDALWITPHYPSPLADGGYDISNHRDVHPMFGALADYDELLRVAHAHGLRVMIDVVPNHVSNEHPWFRAALAGEPDARDRFHFRPSSAEGGPPNNWQSLFGGPAWTRIEGTGLWYLHLFSPEQPDLNWDHPDVAADFDATLRFWLDRGTDGIRVDVAAGLFKDRDLRDNPGLYSPGLFGHGPEQVHTWDQPRVHDVYRSWRRILSGYEHAPASVGEVCLADLDATAAYCRDAELGSAFTIELLKTAWGAESYRHAIAGPIDAFTKVGARPAWVLGNHDKSRMVTRFGGGILGRARARAAAMLLLALPGQAYLYAGDELGLPDATVPDEARVDPIFRRSGRVRAGRDGVRVPLPWTSGDNAGFSPAPGPLYLPQPEGWSSYAAEEQATDSSSSLALYRHLLRLRRSLVVFGTGDGHVTTDGEILILTVLGADGRRGWCVVNMGTDPAAFHRAGCVLVAASDSAVTVLADRVALPAGAGVWLLDQP